jgi:serine/threonine protein kinase
LHCHGHLDDPAVHAAEDTDAASCLHSAGDDEPTEPPAVMPARAPLSDSTSNDPRESLIPAVRYAGERNHAVELPIRVTGQPRLASTIVAAERTAGGAFEVIGKTILHYRILRELGRGGMGVVYEAEDTRLGRRVALKFLPPHAASASPERRRLVGEARAAAALNHPNITHINAIEEFDGDAFIVMEYVEGRELRALVESRELPLDGVVALAIQIATGLKAAHDRGIIHRDVKSTNIMVTGDGRVKIMDFGLAKMVGNTRVTKTGAVVGTTDYMSPEQVRGEDVDHRTDIWSFGIVLYEMLTGQRPFRGDHAQAVMYAIANHDAPSPATLSPDLPGEAIALVKKMLARNRDERCASMTEIIATLELLQRGFSTTRREARDRRKPDTRTALPGVAVLPFSSIRPDPETDFLGFALADQVIGALAYVDSVAVCPSSAVRKFSRRGASFTPISCWRATISKTETRCA